jgi:hypothetical protein
MVGYYKTLYVVSRTPIAGEFYQKNYEELLSTLLQILKIIYRSQIAAICSGFN